jgi:hypothetical protein
MASPRSGPGTLTSRVAPSHGARGPLPRRPTPIPAPGAAPVGAVLARVLRVAQPSCAHRNILNYVRVMCGVARFTARQSFLIPFKSRVVSRASPRGNPF